MSSFVAERLEGVSFVADYLVLQFHGGNAFMYEWPQARTGDSVLQFGEAGYPDRLVGFIGLDVVSADLFLDDGLVLSFGDGELVVSAEQIRSASQPEVVEFGLGGLYEGQTPFD